MTKVFLLLLIAIFPATEEAFALASYTIGNQMVFDYSTGQRQIGFNPGQVTSASGGASDPIVGTWQTLYAPAHTTWDYILVSQISSGVWSLSSDPETLLLTPTSADWNNPARYLLQGLATAQTIDFNTGTVTWGSVSILGVNDLVGSSTLQQFSGYTTGTLTMSFVTDAALQSWAQAPSGSLSRNYSSSLTGTPEPQVWLLWLTGLGLMGYGLYRRRPVLAS